jgi:hypothetical protein
VPSRPVAVLAERRVAQRHPRQAPLRRRPHREAVLAGRHAFLPLRRRLSRRPGLVVPDAAPAS